MPIHGEGAVLDVATKEDGIMSLLTSNWVCLPGALGYPSELALAETAVPPPRRMETGGPRGGGDRRAAASAINTVFHGSHTHSERCEWPREQ